VNLEHINTGDTATAETTDVTELLSRLPHGTVLNEDGPMMPQAVRDLLMVKAEIYMGKIRAGIYRKEHKVEKAFDRSSLTIWEFSPHQPLCHSMEFLYGQMDQLRDHIKRGSWAGVKLLLPIITENCTYSFDRVEQELLEPRYHWRDEQQKRQAQQFYINAWKHRQSSVRGGR
jgi:hypothetical protein